MYETPLNFQPLIIGEFCIKIPPLILFQMLKFFLVNFSESAPSSLFFFRGELWGGRKNYSLAELTS